MNKKINNKLKNNIIILVIARFSRVASPAVEGFLAGLRPAPFFNKVITTSIILPEKNRLLPILLCMVLFFNCKKNETIDMSNSQMAPDFRLEDTSHKRFYLNQHKHKNIIVVFWATWCVICKKYLNDLEKVAPEFIKMDTEIISILIDPENMDLLNEIVKTSVHISYPILLDWKQVVMKKYDAKKMPTTIVIGKNNKIVMKRIGYNISTIEQIQDKLNLLMENKK